jgi:hypothetical protein
MKLPRLSPDEIRALQADPSDAASTLAARIKQHLKAGLPPRVRVEARVLASPASVVEGEPPYLNADDDLLAAWVAARFGSGGVSRPVPVHYATSLLARIAQALAECVLRGLADDASSLHLEIHLNDQHGRLALDWSGMSAQALRKWAVEQWESKHG